MVWFEGRTLPLQEDWRYSARTSLVGYVSNNAYSGKIMRSLLLGAMIVVSLTGCSQDQHDHPNLTTGEQLFNFHCAECHGIRGTGKLFDGIPANILSKKSPEEIARYITTETGYIREMPVFSTMPADEAKMITDHLITLQTAYDKNGPQIEQFLIEP